MILNISGVKLPALCNKIEQTMFNANNRHFMILFVTLKETYTYFFTTVFSLYQCLH